MSIQIGGNYLENGQDPYIIACIDNNWSSIEDAVDSITQAKVAGANAVKFLMYNYDSLYGIPKDKKSAYDAAHDLPEDFLQRLKTQCDRMGIHFMCSVFNPDHIRIVDPYVHAHHITSSEINYVSLLKELAHIRKPVFMHVGCASVIEIQYALSLLGSTPVILMYGVESKPDPATTIDLTLIETLKTLSQYVGFFDMSLDTLYLPYAAVKFHQVCALEKHLNVIKGITPDYRFSIDVSDFKTMVERIKGNGRRFLGRSHQELNLLRKNKRRLIATATIRAGEALRFNKNYGMYASPKSDDTGLFAIDYLDIDGRAAAIDIDVGDSISKGSFVE